MKYTPDCTRSLQSWFRRNIPAAFAVLAVSGCGHYVPPIQAYVGEREEVPVVVNKIANRVKCELIDAVVDVYQPHKSQWLRDWAAKVTLKIIVTERSVFNPGASVTQILPIDTDVINGDIIRTAQSFSLGIGGQFSADATRTETVGFFFVFEDFLLPNSLRCEELPTGIRITSDLKIKEWLEAAVLVAQTGTPSDDFKSGGPIEVIGHDISFVVVAEGGVTPTWKLVNVTANTTSPLIGARRQVTDTVIITMGPLGEITKRERRPSTAVESAHLAAQIGQEVAAALQAQ